MPQPGSFAAIVLGAGIALAGPAAAQPEITWQTFDAGGGTSSGGGYVLSGTIGQPDASGPLTGGALTLAGGFWALEDSCPADWNASGTVTTADISAFLTDWFADIANGTSIADFNGSGVTNTSDLSAFLGAWFAALGGAC